MSANKSPMSPSRSLIISTLRAALEAQPAVLAMWLEGADATRTVDEWSDIDVWLDTRDGEEDVALDAVEAALAVIGEMDFAYLMEQSHPQIRHKVFHLRDTPPHLFIDVCVQSHSRDFAFTEGHDTERPLVLFDKASVIRYRSVSPDEAQRDIANRLARIEGMFAQRPRALAKAERGHFLEALAYYRKFVLEPLVELLRLQHAPRKADYGLKHIERDLPSDAVRQIEALHRVTSCEEIAAGVERATEMFEEARRRLS